MAAERQYGSHMGIGHHAYNSNEIIVAFRGAFQYGVAVGLVGDAFNNTAKAIKGFLSFQC